MRLTRFVTKGTRFSNRTTPATKCFPPDRAYTRNAENTRFQVYQCAHVCKVIDAHTQGR